MTGRSDRHPSDPMLIRFRVRTCHVPREAELSLSDKAGNWTCITGDAYRGVARGGPKGPGGPGTPSPIPQKLLRIKSVRTRNALRIKLIEL